MNHRPVGGDVIAEECLGPLAAYQSYRLDIGSVAQGTLIPKYGVVALGVVVVVVIAVDPGASMVACSCWARCIYGGLFLLGRVYFLGVVVVGPGVLGCHDNPDATRT